MARARKRSASRDPFARFGLRRPPSISARAAGSIGGGSVGEGEVGGEAAGLLEVVGDDLGELVRTRRQVGDPRPAALVELARSAFVSRAYAASRIRPCLNAYSCSPVIVDERCDADQVARLERVERRCRCPSPMRFEGRDRPAPEHVADDGGVRDDPALGRGERVETRVDQRLEAAAGRARVDRSVVAGVAPHLRDLFEEQRVAAG